ncbi:MAG: hypothetical protein H3C28_12525 [Sphingomonadales bacterium]|jgi:hypothetical protein|nr:hypothetical protein [Sphingomonadales bacterium]RIK95674.1 MAG: hypothetical protein DCC73_04765 [Pseudomonadota bacterium]
MSIRLTLAAFAAVAVGAATAALADEKAAPANNPDETAPACLQLYQIDRTEVVDDYTLLFHMKGGKTYVSKFPYRCHGLKFERGFAYSTSIPQICGNVDFITVIRRGNACPLGPFQLYTPEPKKDDKVKD